MIYCHTSEEIWLIKNKFKVLWFFFGGRGLRYLASVTGIQHTE